MVTFDKGFGELAFRLGAAATFGVVLFRISSQSPDHAARAAVVASAASSRRRRRTGSAEVPTKTVAYYAVNMEN